MPILFTGKALLQVFIYLFVIMSGVWVHLGIAENPHELLNTSVLYSLPTLMGFPASFVAIPFIMIFASIGISFYLSRTLGVLGVFFAFLAGYYMTSWWGIFYAFITLMTGFTGPFLNPHNFEYSTE